VIYHFVSSLIHIFCIYRL